jgi:hypothetical protein
MSEFHAAYSSSVKKFRKRSRLLARSLFSLVRVRIQVGPPIFLGTYKNRSMPGTRLVPVVLCVKSPLSKMGVHLHLARE